MPDEEKKIIIDEDWKTQVETEREELDREVKSDAANVEPPDEFTMPPASFEMLLSTLVTEAMVAIGAIPHPATGEPQPNLDQAKYFVDTIEMLAEKTKGNLTEQESSGLTDILHQLRMLFVASQSQPK